MSHDKFFGICENKCLVEINADSVGAAAQDLSNIDNAVFAEKATAAGVGGGGIGSEVVPIENGGTGATTAEEARTNLSVASADHTHTLEEVTGSSVLAIENGGTGATTAEEARTNLNVASVDHTHTLEEITGSSVLPIEKGGTGATTAEEAKINLGINSGSGTVLFSSESGTTDTTITLSDDISNYKYVEVYYKKNSNKQTQSTTSGEWQESFPKGLYEGLMLPEDLHIDVVKTIVKNDSKTNVYMVYYSSEARTNQQTYTDTTNICISSFFTKTRYEVTASFTGNTFSHNSGYWYYYSTSQYNTYYKLLSDGTYEQFNQEGGSVISNITNNVRNQYITETHPPEIYAIVGYE